LQVKLFNLDEGKNSIQGFVGEGRQREERLEDKSRRRKKICHESRRRVYSGEAILQGFGEGLTGGLLISRALVLRKLGG